MSLDTLYCTNVLCECEKHRSDIDNVCKQSIDVLIRAGKQTLPQCSRTDRGIPYWNDEVDDARETALFWHWLWVENGRPRHRNVAAIMRKTRASYHYAVRHIKRRECEARKSKMAESVSMNNQRDLWVETKKMVAGNKSSINTVDGACNPKTISEVFASKYDTLFHGKPTEPTELHSLHTTIRNGIVADDESYSTIALNDVLESLKHIKLGKNDGNHGLTSDHLVNSSGRFLTVLSCHSCFLDASKAFDNINYGKLFNILLRRGIPNAIVRLILDGYIRQRMCAQWESTKSRRFYVSNGVKQGAVISPILFALYSDELIAKLASSGYGCRIAGHFVGALSYAHNTVITLVTGSKTYG